MRRPGARTHAAAAAVVPVVVGACLALSACSLPSPSTVPESGASANGSGLGTAMDTPVPHDVLDAPLTDDAGRPTSLGALRGRDVVLVDTMTQCQETCPLITADLRGARAALGKEAAGVDVVEVTVDPRRDDARHLRAYRALYGVTDGWSFLTGPDSSIARIWSFFGVGYDRVPEGDPPAKDWLTGQLLTYDIQHSDVVVVLDRDLHERLVIVGAPDAQSQSLPRPLATFLNDQGRANLAHPDAGDWTPVQLAQALRRVLTASQ